MTLSVSFNEARRRALSLRQSVDGVIGLRQVFFA